MVQCNECGRSVPDGFSLCGSCGLAVGDAYVRKGCPDCGRTMRSGSVYGDMEATIVFHDTGEERYLRALVCPACRQVQFLVDFETDV
jgi:hypothetical protein